MRPFVVTNRVWYILKTIIFFQFNFLFNIYSLFTKNIENIIVRVRGHRRSRGCGGGYYLQSLQNVESITTVAAAAAPAVAAASSVAVMTRR